LRPGPKWHVHVKYNKCTDDIRYRPWLIARIVAENTMYLVGDS
jgi:hypothetical protein